MEHEGGVVARQRLVHVVVQPALVTQLDRPAERSGGEGQERVETGDVSTPPRRELDEVRAQRRPEPLNSVEVVRQPALGVGQLPAMGAIGPDLHGVLEPGRRLGGPLLNGRHGRQPVEGAVQLDRVEALGVAGEPTTGWESVRIHQAAPVAVLPARATDPQVRGRAHAGLPPASARRSTSRAGVRPARGARHRTTAAGAGPRPAPSRAAARSPAGS